MERKIVMPQDPLSEQSLGCVLLADRHHGLTEGIRGLLETAFKSVVMVADQASLLDGAARLRPEMAILDLSLAPDDCLGLLRALRERCPESVRSAALAAGADAFVLKRSIVTDLLPAVDAIRGRRNA